MELSVVDISHKNATIVTHLSGGRCMTRSEEKIPKLRSRGRANRRKLLQHAERLLAESNGGVVRFSDVFESAGVSRGSAYRIYIGMDDLMQDLAGEWISNFVDFLSSLEPEGSIGDWRRLSDYILARAAEYWMQTADSLRVMPRLRSNVPAAYRTAIGELSRCISDIFERFFDMPQIENWHGKMSFYVQVADLSFSDSIRLNSRITPERLSEAQCLCRRYLSLHLPDEVLPR
jgi:AcrR family transcriptional regulator